jgi:hypothetical protein
MSSMMCFCRTHQQSLSVSGSSIDLVWLNTTSGIDMIRMVNSYHSSSGAFGTATGNLELCVIFLLS